MLVALRGAVLEGDAAGRRGDREERVEEDVEPAAIVTGSGVARLSIQLSTLLLLTMRTVPIPTTTGD